MPRKQERKPEAARKRKVLSVVIHPALATTRELLIQSLGCEVTSVFNLIQLKEACERSPYDLLMISQGISLAEKRRIVTQFRTVFPGTPILELYDFSPDLPEAAFSFNAGEGPDALAVKLKTILANV